MKHKLYVLKKGEKKRINTYLEQHEVDCKCNKDICTITLVSERNADAFEKTRFHFGKPVFVSSGFRCIVHNKREGGKLHSDHPKGDALDIFPEDPQDLVELFEIAENYYDYCYIDFEKGFIHCSKRA